MPKFGKSRVVAAADGLPVLSFMAETLTVAAAALGRAMAVVDAAPAMPSLPTSPLVEADMPGVNGTPCFDVLPTDGATALRFCCPSLEFEPRGARFAGVFAGGGGLR